MTMSHVVLWGVGLVLDQRTDCTNRRFWLPFLGECHMVFAYKCFLVRHLRLGQHHLGATVEQVLDRHLIQLPLVAQPGILQSDDPGPFGPNLQAESESLIEGKASVKECFENPLSFETAPWPCVPK